MKNLRKGECAKKHYAKFYESPSIQKMRKKEKSGIECYGQ